MQDPNDQLWVVGYNLSEVQLPIDLDTLPDYEPALAIFDPNEMVWVDPNEQALEPNVPVVEAIDISGTLGDLGLPTSIIWTNKKK